MSEEILQPNQPAKFSARNLRPKFRRLKAGDIFLVELEIEESVWNALRTVPEDALVEGVLWHHDGDPQPAPKPVEQLAHKSQREPKGEWRFYWQAMHKPDQLGCNFTTFPDLQECLDVDADHVHEALRARFEVASLTTVSPKQFEQFVTEQGLSEGLITMSRNAEVRAAEKAGALV